MKKQYPKNIIQAILLLFIGFMAVVPIIAFMEALNLNISGDIYNNLLFLVLFLVVSLVYFKKNKQQVSFNQFWNTPVRLAAKIWFLLLCFLLLFQLGINMPISKYLTYHMGQRHNISNPLENIGIGIGAILLAPICEEIIFKGIILEYPPYQVHI
ncbi:hypothetical protein [Sphingobacterium sp. UBA5670]|uniref:hypothetical protein n=1 Tax=Sphingobacterium sp. UBA5670 TaxID=1947502 RepID=UPI0025EAA5C7|nr:hypothetical protein [Sphingobacterium sp. UBA5670]